MLPNGIRVVTEAMPHVRSVAVGIWVETGSRVEPESRGGISHLIEHLVFKGTATRSAEAIAGAIDSVGGQMDAFTAKEHTCFYVNVLDDHLALAVDLLTDILMHPLFAAPDIEKEKAVVFQEIKMVEDTADDLVHDLFAERGLGGHPLGRPILGRWDVVRDLERETSSCATSRRSTRRPGSSSRRRATWSTPRRGSVRGALQRVPAPAVVTRESRRPRCIRGVHVVPKPLEQVHLVAGFPGDRGDRAGAVRALPAERRDRRQHVLAAVPGGARAPGARLLDPFRACSPTTTPGSSTSTPAPTRRTSPRW